MARAAARSPPAIPNHQHRKKMTQRSAETLMGMVHGLSTNNYAANASSAFFDMANWQEAVVLINLLSVITAASSLVVQNSDDSSAWETLGTVTVAPAIYNSSVLLRLHRDDVKRYVRVRFVPGSGASIVGSCNILGLMPKAENPIPPTYAFDSQNI